MPVPQLRTAWWWANANASDKNLAGTSTKLANGTFIRMK